MYEIRIFEGSTAEAINVANKFIAANKGHIPMHVQLNPMHDYYQGRPPTICNQWVALTIIFNIVEVARYEEE